jgi:hypothetical protein
MAMKVLITRARDWYGQYERPISSLSLIGGFVFDAIVLKRVDLLWENIWIAAHIILVAIFIILVDLQEHESMNEKDPSKKHFWYINILQFFFGGLLSTFIVFYFRSTTLSVTWPFLLILSAAFIANDSLKKHYSRLVFQISLFFLSLLSFAIFIVPVFFHRIGPDIFLISGGVSLAILGIFLLIIRIFTKEKFKEGGKLLLFSISSIFLTVNILYFLNLIPPIPLSLKDAGIYHSLVRDESGNYLVQYEDQGWFGYFALSEDFHMVPGDPIYAYSAVFSPAMFNNEIVHVWQKYDSETGKWVTITRVDLPTIGGREGGFRTYSMKSNITPGEWRVNVETSEGQIIGRLRFNIIETNTKPILKTDIKI